MSILRRAALFCGIVGGVWSLLSPVLVLLPVVRVWATPPFLGGVEEKKVVSMVQAGMAGDALPLLSFISLAGICGLLGIVLRQKRPRLGRSLLWTSAIAILAAGLVSIFSLGLFFLPASILLLLAAFGLRGEVVR